MAQIALIIEGAGARRVELFKRLKVLVSTGMSGVSTAIDKCEPLFVRQLFDRQDPGFAIRLLEFLEWLESQSLPYRAYQVLDHERFDQSKRSQYYVVNADRLRTMITTRNSSLDQQRQISRLQEREADE